jgi:hypothetical protein
MNLKKTLLLLFVLITASAAPSYAQIFWSNFSPSGVTDDIWSVTYANGTFAAVTSQGKLLTSPDGLSWSSQSIDQGTWLVSIAYGNGTWVVVGDKGAILLSSDLKTWLNATSVTTNKLNGVLYAGTIWVAVGEAGTIVTSLDAKTWVLQPAIPGITGFLHGIAFVPPNSPTGGPGNFFICGQNGALVEGSAPMGTAAYQFTSYAGLQMGSELPFSQNLEALVIAGSTLAEQETLTLVGAGQGTLFFSGLSLGEPPGQTFAKSTSTIPNVDFRGLTVGNGYYIAAGEQGTIMRSTDGKNWVQSFSGDSPTTVSTATLLSAAYSPLLQRFVVAGTGGTILVSNPPPTVFGNVSTRGFVSPTETFIGGFVVQGSAPRTVLIRGDGPVLSTFSVPSPLPDPVVTVFDSTGAVVATNTGWSTNANPAALSTAALEVGAFALPASSADSALLLTLPPGAYTVQITSSKNNSGIALFEAYTD